MKRLSIPLLFLLILIAPIFTLAQDVTGSSIEKIAASVVLIETLIGDNAISSGSGVIISAEGEIYTNRHVVEYGDNFAIYMLNDTREQPRLRFYATLEYSSSDPNIDFAILRIDRDVSGSPINPTAMTLPYLPPTAHPEVNIGQSIRIFGYPGIGDGYMVTTAGEIVTVQNGTIGDERLPVWYWTDAEISSGNSGGLVVDENGMLIGLPTWVVSEDRTAGRLGGILPLVAIEKSLTVTPSETTAGANTSIFMVTNDSSEMICYVYISPSNWDDWGDDRLDSDEVINAGRSRAWDLSPGNYDVLLLDCSGDTLEDARNIELEEMVNFTYPNDKPGLFDRASAGELTVVNESVATICFVYISPTTSDDWGDDQLNIWETISPGEDRTWAFEPDLYDMLLEDCDHNVLDDVREIDLSRGQTIELN